MRILAASLPEYLPSVNFYRKMLNCDVFVLADTLQFSKHSPVNRTRIKSANSLQWLTVPVLSSKKGIQKINTVKILPESNWQRKHKTALMSYYKYAPFFEHYIYKLEPIFQTRWESIYELNLANIELIKNLLRIKRDINLFSQLKTGETGTDQIIEMVNKFDCNAYLIFESETTFVDEEKLKSAGIKLHILRNDFKPYTQQFDIFEPNLSVIDLLFNTGNESLQYL